VTKSNKIFLDDQTHQSRAEVPTFC